MVNNNPAVHAAYKALKIGAKEMLKRSGKDCDMNDCEYYSLGFKCSCCSRSLCNGHLYFKLDTKTSKPLTICPSCIVDENPELFEGNHVNNEYEI